MNASTHENQGHRFRTHLAAIVSSTELLQHYGPHLSALEQDNLLGEIREAAEQMRRMLDQPNAPAFVARQAAAANEPA